MKVRILVIAIASAAVFALLISRFFYLQIVQQPTWTQIARGQHEYQVMIPFKRGSFYSNTEIKQGHPQPPQPLVFDVTKFHVYVDPVAIPAIDALPIAQALSELLDIDQEDILSELHKKSRSRRIAKWVSTEDKKHVLAWWECYARTRKIASNAIFFVTDYQRCYPFKALLGQVLHTIQDHKDEQGRALPTGGVEAYFDTYLQGKPGMRKLMRSPRNTLDMDVIVQEPEDGADVYLTVNHYIQAICEEEIEKAVHIHQAKGGWALMMDPYTGAILAYAQYPFFNPQEYQQFFNDPEKIEYTRVKAIQDAYEMGSIIKPINLSIALHANETETIWDPFAPIDTTRSYFPGRNKPLKDARTYRQLNMFMALQRSSNVYMAQLIDKLIQRKGALWYRDQLCRMGFGQKTGIELPAEAYGLVPRFGKTSNDGLLEWSKATPYSLAIGYNMLCTPLQILRAYAAIINGGYLVQPTLLKKIVKKNPNGSETVITASQSQPIQLFQPHTVNLVKQAMKYVTKPGGNSTKAEIAGFSEGGKTGSAEKLVDGEYAHNKHIVSFIGFVPACDVQKSRFLLLVSIDDPAYIIEDGVKKYMAGQCATPVFREIATKTLAYLGVEPDDPYGYPKGDPRCDLEKADWAKQVAELKLLFEQWNS